ncbi:ABC transporter permease [bacterium]|nr:ABC transporter permease [bacterium]
MNIQSLFFFAYRFLFSSSKDASLRSIIYTAYTTIALTTFSCALILSIMHGFHDATKKTIQSIYPDIIIDGNGRYINEEKIYSTLQKHTLPISGISPHSVQEIMLYNQKEEIHHIGFLQALDPQKDVLVTPLQTMMIDPAKQFHFTSNSIIIGKELAQSLHVYTGDCLTILIPDTETISRKSIKFKTHDVTISGILQTGMYEFDNAIALIPFSLFFELFPEQGVQKIYIKALPGKAEAALKHIQSIFPKAYIYSWESLYPQLIATFSMEEIALYLIIILLGLLACSTIISVLSIYLTLKKIDCAILIAFGAQTRDIWYIFLLITASITTIASSIGLVCAYIAGLLLQTIIIIPLPEHTYYTKHLPVILDFFTFLIIFIATLCIGLLISIIPLYSLKKQSITQILKSEL